MASKLVLMSLVDTRSFRHSRSRAALGSAMSLVYLALVLFGQILNFSVYRAIGKVGVYYGVKFGFNIPWCTDFPYNSPSIPGWGPILAHPQYCGAVLSYLGIFGLICSTLPVSYFLIFAAGTLSSYIFMSTVEGWF